MITQGYLRLGSRDIGETPHSGEGIPPIGCALRMFLGSSDAQLGNRLLRLLEELSIDRLHALRAAAGDPVGPDAGKVWADFYPCYAAAGLLATIEWWLDRRERIGPEEMARAVGQAIVYGTAAFIPPQRKSDGTEAPIGR